MATSSIAVVESPRVLFALRRADDALILGHRLSEWTGRAPMLEEELALANIALDLIGQARALYTYAAAKEGRGHTEDAYAYLRDAPQYRNLLLVEQPNGDFASSVARQFLFSAFAHPYWHAMTRSSDADLAAIADRSEKESAYHLRHAAEWLIRLGDGTEESHLRTQDAVDVLWPYSGEMFEADEAERGLVANGVLIDPDRIRPAFEATVARVLADATLSPPASGWMQRGGRSGRHSEHLGHLLAEMQHLQRTYPGAVW
ncbi:MAG: phenylacetate-CoA oxygenase subunit PaaC [Acetobacteraceae bacterium]|nr:phenylacetate-CoA oxygenase subunit PaaC [Acetobacteraceae bacterium]